MAYDNELETWWHSLPGEIQSAFGFAFNWANDGLKAVAGDPDDLVRAGGVYANLGPQIVTIGENLKSDATALNADWTGDAFDAFAAKIDQLTQTVKNAGDMTTSTQEVLEAGAQGAVDGANAIIDLVKTIIEFLIGTLVLALATSIISLGASMAAWFAEAAAEGAIACTEITGIMTRVGQVLIKIASILEKIAKILREISALFKDWTAMIRAMKAFPTFTKAGLGSYASQQVEKFLMTKTVNLIGVPTVPSGVTDGIPSVGGDLGDLHQDVEDAQNASYLAERAVDLVETRHERVHLRVERGRDLVDLRAHVAVGSSSRTAASAAPSARFTTSTTVSPTDSRASPRSARTDTSSETSSPRPVTMARTWSFASAAVNSRRATSSTALRVDGRDAQPGERLGQASSAPVIVRPSSARHRCCSTIARLAAMICSLLRVSAVRTASSMDAPSFCGGHRVRGGLEGQRREPSAGDDGRDRSVRRTSTDVGNSCAARIVSAIRVAFCCRARMASVGSGVAVTRDTLRTADHPSRSSTKHQRQASPGSMLRMTGCAVSREVLRRVLLRRGVAAADVAARQAQPQVHPAGAVAQALLAPVGRVRRDDPRRVAQVLAVAGAFARCGQFVVDPPGGVGDAVQHGLLQVDGAQRGAQHLVVVHAAVARREDRAALGRQHLHAQPTIGRGRRLELVLRTAELFPDAVAAFRARARAVPRGSRAGRRPSRPGRARRVRARAASVTRPAACSASSAAFGPDSRRRRTSQGSVRPWSSSVPATTVKAARASTLRAGVSAGSRNTAASVTTPRMPAHETITAEVHGHVPPGSTFDTPVDAHHPDDARDDGRGEDEQAGTDDARPGQAGVA